jgi:hypothetical protein
MFEELGAIIRDEVVRHLFHVEVQPEEAQQLQPAASPDSERLSYEHEALAGADAIAAAGGNGSGNGGGAAFTAGAVGAGATSVATGQRTVSAEAALPAATTAAGAEGKSSEVPRRLTDRPRSSAASRFQPTPIAAARSERHTSRGLRGRTATDLFRMDTV